MSLVDALRPIIQRSADRAPTLALLVSADLRRHLRAFLVRQGLDTPVLTHAELAPDFRLEVLDTVRHAQVMPPPAIRPVRETPHLVAVEA